MESAALHRRHEFSANHSPSATLLFQLGGAHDALQSEMAAIDRLTTGPRPDHASFTAARWRLSQASLQRRALTARIVEFLCTRVRSEDVEELNRFRSADRQMMQRSAQHVRSWTIQSINQDWAGYCEASRGIRAHMARHISLERRLFPPLLETLASRGL